MSMAAPAHPTLESRKIDHISLTEQAQILSTMKDDRFYYEPLFSGIEGLQLKPFQFLNKTFKAPLWISSMTGGTELALKINRNLARACREFGLGMGLGSCRALLESEKRLQDFDIREELGEDRPLFANLGIAQVEQSLEANAIDAIREMITKLRADGLIIHINPLQEWLQPEGDRYRQTPLQTIESFLKLVDFPVIVKEVGQGMGPKTLLSLLKLPLAAIDFAAQGGTNFSKLELLRSDEQRSQSLDPLVRVGHSAEEMLGFLSHILKDNSEDIRCRQIIISGGIQSFLDGYYLTQKCELNSVYGQASRFLKYAKKSYESLHHFLEQQISGLIIANALLIPK